MQGGLHQYVMTSSDKQSELDIPQLKLGEEFKSHLKIPGGRKLSTIQKLPVQGASCAGPGLAGICLRISNKQLRLEGGLGGLGGLGPVTAHLTGHSA